MNHRDTLHYVLALMLKAKREALTGHPTVARTTVEKAGAAWQRFLDDAIDDIRGSADLELLANTTNQLRAAMTQVITHC